MTNKEKLDSLTPEERAMWDAFVDAMEREDFDNWVTEGKSQPSDTEMRSRSLAYLDSIIDARPKPEPDYAAWVPDYWQTYWYLDNYGIADAVIWHDQPPSDNTDRARLVAANVFPTQEAAECEQRETIAWRELKRLARAMWDASDARGRNSYTIVCAAGEWQVFVYDETLSFAAAPLFSSREKAQHSLDILRDGGHLDHLVNLEAS